MNTIILVKNQAGMRDLYELVSRSHIEFYGSKKPRIPKTVLSGKRENLLLAEFGFGGFLRTVGNL